MIIQLINRGKGSIAVTNCKEVWGNLVYTPHVGQKVR